MKAAVVHSFNAPPEIADFAEPIAADGEIVIEVTAAPLSPIVKFLAAGKHYAGGGSAGFVAGVDGVGIDPQGRRVYFLFPKTPFGSMAEKSLVPASMVVAIPDELADDRAAAIATAGIASWMALTRRAPLQKGQTVLVTGATGAAGGLALQVARHLGAGKVIAVGRERDRLAKLDADVKIPLDQDAASALRAEFDHGVDIVLDFVWGAPAGEVLAAAATNRGSRTGEPQLRYVVLGNVGGNEVPVRADMLRGSGLELIGNGIGSVAVADMLLGARELLSAAATAGFTPDFSTVPLSEVGRVWQGGSEVRYVVRPKSVA